MCLISSESFVFLNLFLFLCTWFWFFILPLPGSSVSFYVSQFPSMVMLRNEDQVQITCSWNISTRAKVKWFKDDHTVKFNQTDKLVQRNPSESNSMLVLKKPLIKWCRFLYVWSYARHTSAGEGKPNGDKHHIWAGKWWVCFFQTYHFIRLDWIKMKQGWLGSHEAVFLINLSKFVRNVKILLNIDVIEPNIMNYKSKLTSGWMRYFMT